MEEIKTETSTMGMQAIKRMWPVFLMTPFVKKKEKEKHSCSRQALVMTRALYISSPIKISINHSEQAGWFHEEFDLVNWKGGLLSVVVRYLHKCCGVHVVLNNEFQQYVDYGDNRILKAGS